MSETSDRIEIKGLRLFGRHGVFEFEKEVAQPFVIDLSMQVDVRQPGASDHLEDTVSYVEIIDSVKDIVENQSHSLLEHLAELIATEVLLRKRVNAVDVTVKKPHAAVGANIEYSAVIIHRP